MMAVNALPRIVHLIEEAECDSHSDDWEVAIDWLRVGDHEPRLSVFVDERSRVNEDDEH